MKAADLDDRDVLGVVQNSCWERESWTFTALIAERFPAVPFKVVAAKLSKLLKRGLLTGCDCGCRGDWELTDKGRELVALPPSSGRPS